MIVYVDLVVYCHQNLSPTRAKALSVSPVHRGARPAGSQMHRTSSLSHLPAPALPFPLPGAPATLFQDEKILFRFRAPLPRHLLSSQKPSLGSTCPPLWPHPLWLGLRQSADRTLPHLPEPSTPGARNAFQLGLQFLGHAAGMSLISPACRGRVEA